MSCALHALALMGALASMPGGAPPSASSGQAAVTAIDILIDPDEVMLKRALAANERLRAQYADGFALDETHRPHISILQRYVRSADLGKVYEAVDNVLGKEKPSTWKLKAYKFYFIPWGDVGLAGIVVEPTDDLVRLQRKLIEAVAPYATETGSSAAFATTKEAPEINQQTIDYVAKYVSSSAGARFNPHVTVGVAPKAYLDSMLAERFEPFTFAPARVSIYQLGNLGTARKKLKSWDIEP